MYPCIGQIGLKSIFYLKANKVISDTWTNNNIMYIITFTEFMC